MWCFVVVCPVKCGLIPIFPDIPYFVPLCPHIGHYVRTWVGLSGLVGMVVPWPLMGGWVRMCSVPFPGALGV